MRVRIALLALASCAIVAGGAAAWKQLDRRPAWVMSFSAFGHAASETEALAEERAALARGLGVVARGGSPRPSLQGETTAREGLGRTFVAMRTAVLRSDDSPSLLKIFVKLRDVPNVDATDPRRAIRPPDFAFACLLVALLFGLAVLEPAPHGERGVRITPALAVLNGSMLGFSAAAVILVEGGWPRFVLPVSVTLAIVPSVAWLMRFRASGRLGVPLGLPYAVLVSLTALVSIAWILRIAWFSIAG